jgi:hypothetical protein
MVKRELFLILLVLSVISLYPGKINASYQAGEDDSICLGCHGNKDFSTKLKNGDKLPLFVDEHILGDSAHKSVGCKACHSGFSASDHPQKVFNSRRNFTVTLSGLCNQCHTFKQGIHSRMLIMLKELVCTDCHGSHSVKVVQNSGETCLGCHKAGLSKTFKDGEKQALHIDENGLKSSVHSKLRCPDCHFGFSSREHPERNFATKRDFTIVATEICRRCHFDKYTRTLESIHFKTMMKGNQKTPVCVDCHGSHAINSGRKEKVLSAKRCANCHSDIYNTYVGSVHGNALVSDHNQDVPVCSDCHKAHDISDTHMSDFRNNIPQMCGKCHANEDLMKKYGLSTSVLQSYLEDFHGVTLTYYKKQSKSERHIAVCTDCHGIHDITRTKGPNASIVKANLLKRCQKCHQGASANFPDSWISHYEPNFKRAPLVYAVNFIYSIFIPFMLIGLVLQIILHIWRYAVNR